jgi:hypothetical protein
VRWSTQAALTLRNAGLTNMQILDAGMIGWEATGLPVNRGTHRGDLERQFRLLAGSIGLSSILDWLAAGSGGGLAAAAPTNTCAMGMLLSRLPHNRGATCDIRTVVSRFVDTAADGANAS